MKFIFNRHDIKPDIGKVRAIIDSPSPKNIKDLQRFLSIINYFGTYIPNLTVSILRDLLKKNSLWQWNENHEKVFIH